MANSVQVTIGGVPAPVAYAGLVEAGLYQFQVTVPNVPGGDAAVVAQLVDFRPSQRRYGSPPMEFALRLTF